MAKNFDEATKEAENAFEEYYNNDNAPEDITPEQGIDSGNAENTESAEPITDNAAQAADIPTDLTDNTAQTAEPTNTDGANPQAANAEADALETQAAQDSQVIDEAVSTAETAAQELNRTSTELGQMREQNAALQEQLRQLSEQIKQMSQQQEESIVAETITQPHLDINGLAFADDETVAAAETEYAKQMAEYVRGGLMDELAPYINEAKEGKRRAQRDEVFDGLSRVKELDGISGRRRQLDSIIESNKALSSDDIPDDEKYIMAYAIARGIDAMNAPPQEPPKEMTPEEFLEKYKTNEEYRKLIEQDRISAVKDSQQVPQFSASSGAVNAALNIPEKPKTWEEASERTRHAFR